MQARNIEWPAVYAGTMTGSTTSTCTQQGRKALARRDLPSAYRFAQDALHLDPRDAQAHALLGIVLSARNDLSSGEWHFRRALELMPDDAESLANLAVNLIRQGRADQADAYFARADALTPNRLQLLAQWSKLHEMQGDLVRAGELLDRAAAASSDDDVGLLRVGLMVRHGQHREALTILEQVVDPGVDAQLERGRLRDRLGHHDEAWQDWVQAKARLAAQAGTEAYRPEAVDALFARLRAFFVRGPNLELLPQAPPRRDTAQPVFILGFPRSGTTLVERILSSHSAVRAGGELPFAGEWPPLLDRLLPGAASFPENLAQACSADWHHLACLLRDHYLARAEAHGLCAPGKRFFTDKMPFNALWLPLMRMAFPQAKIVHLQRHPLDVCVSMLSHRLTHGFNCGHRIETIVHHLGAMAGLVEHYRRELQPDMLTLRYEDLVRRPEQEIHRLLDYLELPFEPGCLAFHRNRTYAATPSYTQVTEALNDRSIGRYRNHAKPLRAFVPSLAPWLRAEGYEWEP